MAADKESIDSMKNYLACADGINKFDGETSDLLGDPTVVVVPASRDKVSGFYVFKNGSSKFFQIPEKADTSTETTSIYKLAMDLPGRSSTVYFTITNKKTD